MDFYFNDNEIEELFRYINFKNGQLIPDIVFNSDQYIVLSTYEDFFKCQQTETTHFFLKAESFSIEPLVVTRNQFMKCEKYTLNQREGGPYIDLMFFRGYAEDAIIQYKASNIDIYPKFIHAHGNTEFEATNELKEYYNDIVKYIRSKCKIIKKKNKKYWISKEVLKDCRQFPNF
jgi:hypothetical protein